MSRIPEFLFGIASVALFAGCPDFGSMDLSIGGEKSTWEKVESYQAVWAEDGEHFAYVRHSYEAFSSPYSLGFGTQNHKHELFITDRAQKKPKRIMEFQGGDILTLRTVTHYMREAGYLLFRQEHFGSGMPATYWRVALDGTTVVAGNESGLEMIPSPDGARIAEVRYPYEPFGCGYPRKETVVSCVIQLRFLDAATLEPVWPADSVAFTLGGESGELLRSRPTPVWSPAGEFFLTNEHEAVRWVPGQAHARQGPRACREPRTSSSAISSSREVIVSGGTGKKLLIASAPDSVPVFGCPQGEG